jgi:hypothetical protein
MIAVAFLAAALLFGLAVRDAVLKGRVIYDMRGESWQDTRIEWRDLAGMILRGLLIGAAYYPTAVAFFTGPCVPPLAPFLPQAVVLMYAGLMAVFGRFTVLDTQFAKMMRRQPGKPRSLAQTRILYTSLSTRLFDRWKFGALTLVALVAALTAC